VFESDFADMCADIFRLVLVGGQRNYECCQQFCLVDNETQKKQLNLLEIGLGNKKRKS
jgi:hypothetical protein